MKCLRDSRYHQKWSTGLWAKVPVISSPCWCAGTPWWLNECLVIMQLITLIHMVAHSQIQLNVEKHPVSVVPNQITATFKKKVKTTPRQGFFETAVSIWKWDNSIEKPPCLWIPWISTTLFRNPGTIYRIESLSVGAVTRQVLERILHNWVMSIQLTYQPTIPPQNPVLK